MVKIYRDADGRINMSVEQEELHTLVAYMGVGISSEAERFAREHKLTIPSFVEQSPLFEAMAKYVKMEDNTYEG